ADARWRRIADEQPPVRSRVADTRAERVVVRVTGAHDLCAEFRDRALARRIDVAVEVDHAPAAEPLRAPGERPAVVAVGCARDRRRRRVGDAAEQPLAPARAPAYLE